MSLSFDRPNKLAVVPIPDTEITVQEVYDECRDYEDRSGTSMAFDDLVDAEGKTDLGTGSFIVVTLFMVNSWRIAFADRAGPSLVVCQVSGGNTLGRVGNKGSAVQHPIAPTLFTHATIDQASTGLIQAQATADLLSIKQIMFNRLETDPVTGVMTLYEDDAVTVLKTWDIWEDIAQIQRYRSQGMERRDA